jgi:hypothetical protein
MKRLILFCLLPLFSSPLEGEGFENLVPSNDFVYTLLRHSGAWDPHGDLWPDIADALSRTTSVRPWPARRVLDAADPALFESPFLLLTGRGAFSLPDEDVSRLREYLARGGFLLVDNAEADRGGPFARSALALPARLEPGGAWRPVPGDHAVFRSFYFLRRASGRRRAEGRLLGFWSGDRLAAVYAPDDLHGAWVRAPAGGWLFPCEPDGEPQRQEAHRLLINVVMYSLTGTYKTDAIHQDFLKEKESLP